MHQFTRSGADDGEMVAAIPVKSESLCKLRLAAVEIVNLFVYNLGRISVLHDRALVQNRKRSGITFEKYNGLNRS